MNAALITVILMVSLVSGTATSILAYRLASNPDASDRRMMSERELAVARWMVPAVCFVLGAVFPLFFFAALGITHRRARSTA
jgi:heme/copper-type cytochrome/quinol oxidase subunit 2